MSYVPEVFEIAIQVFQKGEQLTKESAKHDVIEALKQFKHFRGLLREENYMDYFYEVIPFLKYHRVKRRDIVFHHGDKGGVFYFILKGRAAVFVPKPEEQIDKETQLLHFIDTVIENAKKTSDKDSKNYFELQRLEAVKQLQALQQETSEELLSKQRIRYFTAEGVCKFKQVNTLEPQDSFGEVSIISSKRSRTASVLAQDEDLHLLSIDGDHYVQVFDQELSRLNFTLKILEQSFPNASRDAIVRLAYEFKEQILDKDQVIFRSGSEAKHVYLIKSGQVEIYQDIALNDSSSSLQTSKVSGNKQPPPQLQRKYERKQYVLALLSSEAFFGMEEKKTYVFSARSVSANTAVYAVERTFFDEYGILKMLQRKIGAKNIFYKQRILDLQSFETSQNVEKDRNKKINIKELLNEHLASHTSKSASNLLEVAQKRVLIEDRDTFQSSIGFNNESQDYLSKNTGQQDICIDSSKRTIINESPDLINKRIYAIQEDNQANQPIQNVNQFKQLNVPMNFQKKRHEFHSMHSLKHVLPLQEVNSIETSGRSNPSLLIPLVEQSQSISLKEFEKYKASPHRQTYSNKFNSFENKIKSNPFIAGEIISSHTNKCLPLPPMSQPPPPPKMFTSMVNLPLETKENGNSPANWSQKNLDQRKPERRSLRNLNVDIISLKNQSNLQQKDAEKVTDEAQQSTGMPKLQFRQVIQDFLGSKEVAESFRYFCKSPDSHFCNSPTQKISKQSNNLMYEIETKSAREKIEQTLTYNQTVLNSKRVEQAARIPGLENQDTQLLSKAKKCQQIKMKRVQYRSYLHRLTDQEHLQLVLQRIEPKEDDLSKRDNQQLILPIMCFSSNSTVLSKDKETNPLLTRTPTGSIPFLIQEHNSPKNSDIAYLTIKEKDTLLSMASKYLNKSEKLKLYKNKPNFHLLDTKKIKSQTSRIPSLNKLQTERYKDEESSPNNLGSQFTQPASFQVIHSKNK